MLAPTKFGCSYIEDRPLHDRETGIRGNPLVPGETSEAGQVPESGCKTGHPGGAIKLLGGSPWHRACSAPEGPARVTGGHRLADMKRAHHMMRPSHSFSDAACPCSPSGVARRQEAEVPATPLERGWPWARGPEIRGSRRGRSARHQPPGTARNRSEAARPF